MNNVLKVLASLVVALIMSGCSTKYSLLYQTNVVPNFKPDTSDPLTFNLETLYNGVIFSIRNNSDQTAKIIWDKSYFIMPDGNSFKALNTDILKEEMEIVAKAQYVSTIPSKSTFKRFTTATPYASKVKLENVATFYNTWGSNRFVHTRYITEEFIRSGAYWKADITAAFSESNMPANEINLNTEQLKHALKVKNENLIKNESKAMAVLVPFGNSMSQDNNNLGLGLVIEHRGIEKEYRFDIKILKVDAVKLVACTPNMSDGTEAKTIKKYIIDYTLDIPTNKWVRNGAELKD